MKLRKIFVLIVAAAVLMLAAGCGKKQTITVDADGIVNALISQVKFDTKIDDVGDNAALYFPDLPKGAAAKLYSGSGYYADEVCLITLQDEAQGPDAIRAVEKHIAELRNQFMNYVPEELGKIDNALVEQKGNFVFVCITNDMDTARKILKNGAASENTDITQPGTEPVPETMPEESVPETTETTPTTPPAPEYPKLTSKSGEYHKYETLTIRVDDTAFELYGYDDAAAEAYTKLVNKAAEALRGQTKVYDLAIPTAIGVVLPDDIAAQMSGYVDQGEVIEKVYKKLSADVIPVRCFDNMMMHRDEYLYFHTDYHWNGRGAYYAYESFCNTKNVAPVTLSERTEKKFDGFLGALYSQSCGHDPILKANPDTVYAYCPKSQSASMQFTDHKGNTFDWSIISDVTTWDPGTKYSTFAGADNPIAVFKNPEVTDGSVCVVVKESYGNALLPYLVDHYSTIYEIDYRYWSGNLVDFVKEKQADDLLFANNLIMISSSFLIGKMANII